MLILIISLPQTQLKRTNRKYFIGYSDEAIRPLALIKPKMSEFKVI